MENPLESFADVVIEPDYTDIGDLQNMNPEKDLTIEPIIPETTLFNIEDPIYLFKQNPSIISRKEGTNPDLIGDLVLSASEKLLKQYLIEEGFGDHHVEVYDNWIFRNLTGNVYSRKIDFKDGRSIWFENLRLFRPRYTRDGKVFPLTPKLAREQGITYGSDLHVDFVLKQPGGIDSPEINRRPGICIGSIPVMLKSRNCILHGRTPHELALFGEDPSDPGGYFIIDGTEKTVLLQEKLVSNKILLMNMDSKGTTVARMTTDTVRGTALVQLVLDKKTQTIIKMQFPSMRTDIAGKKSRSLNVLTIFRIFGTIFGIDEYGNPDYIKQRISLFMKPDRVKKSLLKLTRNLVNYTMFTNDIDIIMNKIDKSKLTQEQKINEVLRIFDADLFPHLNELPGPDKESINERRFRIIDAKLNLLSIMTARFLEYKAGFRQLDNRDSWSNKRVEGAGRMMEQLFRNAWKYSLGTVKAAIENGHVTDLGGAVEKLKSSIITDTFHNSFITSNWGVKGNQMKNNVAQTLVRDSVVATFAHLNTVDVSISRTDRQQALRLVQNEQWGFVCFVSSPEGETCLHSETLVYDRYFNPIKISQVKDGDVMMSLDPITHELTETIVQNCFTKSSKEYGKRMFKIETLNGKDVIATGDHKFLTGSGFKNTEDITLKDKLCVTYTPTPYSHSCDQISFMMTSEIFTAKMHAWGVKTVTIASYIKELHDRNLIDILNVDLRAPILARMAGFLLTDGNMRLKSEYPSLTGYFGCKEDATEFRKDALRLDFYMEPEQLNKGEMIEEGTGREITHYVYRVEYTGPLAALLMCLGVTVGKKTVQNSEIPFWITNASKMTKREFLAGLIGGDGGKVSIRVDKKGTTHYRINHFTQSKHDGYVENGELYMANIGKLMNEFGIDTTKPGKEKYAQGITLRLNFSETCDNILRYMYNVGFRYCQKKLTESLQVSEYLKYREICVKKRLELKNRVVSLRESGLMPKAISDQYNIPYNQVRSLLCNKNTQLPKAPKGTITYHEWSDLIYANNGSIYIPIKSITAAPDCMVCDYTTVSNNHTIICANGIVSHNCGIIKNLSVTSKLSVERSDTDIIRRLIGDEGIGWQSRISNAPTAKRIDKMLVNGKFIGWCDGTETQHFLTDLRRRGDLYLDMAVIKEDDWIYVDISPSRLVRPLLIVNPDQTLAIDTLNDKVGLRGQPNYILLKSGAMEYMSPWEQEYIKIATTTDKIKERQDLFEDADDTHKSAVIALKAAERGERVLIEKVRRGETIVLYNDYMTVEDANNRLNDAKEELEKLKKNAPYTHCELDPLAILGVAAALIPWPDHNQAPRNTYQVSMGKQALGIYHSNHLNRFDGKTKVLAFGTRPVVETSMYDVIGLDHRGPGETVKIAFIAFPYTEEDSFIVKKEFLDNGGFRLYKYLTYKTVIRHNGIVTEALDNPGARPGESSDRYKYIESGENNPMKGLPKLGAPLRQNDYVIGKVQYISGQKGGRNESVVLRVGDDGVVDKVLVTTDHKTTIVTVKLRVMRVPKEGDKFAPRNAQKATIGLVMSDADLPCDEYGVAPDFIVNPSSLPSRMTLSYPDELIASKHAAFRCVSVNAGAFRPFELDTYRKTLIKYGKQEFGYEKMFSGTSGKELQAQIFAGPVYMQALKHHVEDKIQARSTGQIKPMTHQAPKGKFLPM